MCSIMVDTGSGISERQFADSFSKTISRGPDDTRIIRKGSGIMGFHRLSIMGLTPEGMQPFLLDDDAIVCNGEIYGFMKLKKQLEKKYSFKSDSDCEILLPYGVSMAQRCSRCWTRSLPWSYMTALPHPLLQPATPLESAPSTSAMEKTTRSSSLLSLRTL